MVDRGKWAGLACRIFATTSLAIIVSCSRSKAPPSPSPPVQPRELAPIVRVREPAVAGGFYPADPEDLRREVDSLLSAAPLRPVPGLRALVCPHAGYRFSGPVAASAFKQLVGKNFEHVAIMAVSHYVPFSGVALPAADALRTPLGEIPVAGVAKSLTSSPLFVVDSAPHTREHSLEVELPFLQRVLGKFDIIPLVFGDVDEAAVASRLSALVNPQTFFIASSDLSHYHTYEKAQALDHDTVDAIVHLDVERLRAGQACGKSPVLTLVHLARLRGWKAQLLDYRNSGDTAGDKSRVVGYAAIAFFEDKG